MKKIMIIAACLVGLAVVGVRGRLVTIHYPEMIDNQTLSNPVVVDHFDGERIILTDGRIIRLDAPVGAERKRLLKAGSEIEIDASDGDGNFTLWGNETRFICGGTYAFSIPIIPREVDCNTRSIIGFGCFAETSDATQSSLGAE